MYNPLLADKVIVNRPVSAFNYVRLCTRAKLSFAHK